MPTEIPFDWREDETSVVFVLDAKGVKAKNVSVAICDVYVKVNVPPALFEVDLLHEIDPEHPKTRCRVSPNKVTLTLQKKEKQLWGEFRLVAPKAELRARRDGALKLLQEREEERLKKRQEFKQEMLKQGEHAQWRLDSQNRETIEKWEKEERDRWEEEVFRSFDEETGALLPDTQPTIEEITEEDKAEAPATSLPLPTSSSPPLEEEEPSKSAETALATQAADQQIWGQEDLEETEEYVPEVRDNPGKIGIRFTTRPRPGVPVRDRGRKAPPFPKDAPKSEAPPMIAGDEEDESDPVWLKDKGDKLMTLGDYQGAYNAYTEALKLASNARCFANRAVAALYLGNFEQCLEDCNRSIQILDFRNKPRPGEISHTADPEDEKVRARVEVRMGVAYLWLGAFQKAEAHFEKALSSEGLEAEEAKQVRLDLQRVQAAKQALQEKEQADQTLRSAKADDKEVLDKALHLYGEAAATSQEECAVVYANRCQARLKLGQLRECLEDADAALRALRRWPCAGKAPKPPARPSGLEPPFLDDPTFVHPDQQNQGEREWLMKHNGGSVKDLPGLPDDYEWVKDSAEKNEDAWIAVKKRMSKATIDAIKRTTAELQDALYLRNPAMIRQQIEVATEQNKAREGPSSKAIQQAEEYARKLEEHEKAQEAQRDQEEAELRQEAEELDLEEALSQRRTGRGQAGFGPLHPLQRTRRRLFVKILLRRSRCYELLGHPSESLDDLNAVLQVEPSNVEAKQRREVLLEAMAPTSAPSSRGPQEEASVEASPATIEEAPAAVAQGDSPPVATEGPAGEADDDGGPDHASTSALLSSGTEYLKRGDYTSALQIFNYALRTCKSFETPLQEVKVLSNTTLCLSKLPGRLPELVAACNSALRRLKEVRAGSPSAEEVEMLQLEAALLSRRGSAYAQQKRTAESAEDAASAKALLSRLSELKGEPRS